MKGASRMGSCAPRPWPWQSASTAQALRPASGSVSGSSAPSLQSLGTSTNEGSRSIQNRYGQCSMPSDHIARRGAAT